MTGAFEARSEEPERRRKSSMKALAEMHGNRDIMEINRLRTYLLGYRIAIYFCDIAQCADCGTAAARLRRT